MASLLYQTLDSNNHFNTTKNFSGIPFFHDLGPMHSAPVDPLFVAP